MYCIQAARTRQDGTMEEIEANTQQLLHALFPGKCILLLLLLLVLLWILTTDTTIDCSSTSSSSIATASTATASTATVAIASAITRKYNMASD
jgi:hypothetical protein